MRMSCHRVTRLRGGFSIVFGASILIGTSGCGAAPAGGNARPQATASGKVTFDGQPVPSGSIAFRHEESGNTAECMISDGAYESESGAGPLIGKNTVSIVGLDGPGGKPLWGGAWSREVDVQGDTFTQDFDVKKSETKKVKVIDDEGEEKPLYE